MEAVLALAAEVEEGRLARVALDVHVEAAVDKLHHKADLGVAVRGPAHQEMEARDPSLAGHVHRGALLEEKLGGLGVPLADGHKKGRPPLPVGAVDASALVEKPGHKVVVPREGGAVKEGLPDLVAPVDAAAGIDTLLNLVFELKKVNI